jgi:hypothetical protein
MKIAIRPPLQPIQGERALSEPTELRWRLSQQFLAITLRNARRSRRRQVSRSTNTARCGPAAR